METSSFSKERSAESHGSRFFITLIAFMDLFCTQFNFCVFVLLSISESFLQTYTSSRRALETMDYQ